METQAALLKVFSKRPSRFALLDKGLQLAGLDRDTKVLEVGCAYGDAAFYIARRYGCDVTGADISGEAVAAAAGRQEDPPEGSRVEFIRMDAQTMRLPADSYGLIVSEAAFSPIPRKKDAVLNYFRALGPGGRLLINDFAIRYKGYEDLRKDMAHIPCFAGVGTIGEYAELLEGCGFRKIRAQEEYGELIQLALYLRKVYGVPPADLGRLFSAYINEKRHGCLSKGESREDFLNKARLTYCQLLFEKSVGPETD